MEVGFFYWAQGVSLPESMVEKVEILHRISYGMEEMRSPGPTWFCSNQRGASSVRNLPYHPKNSEHRDSLQILA